ncbi:ankyrin repeat domain-containing protein [Dyadobacter arcticus]|uniref:Ankyrin repeat protein n=1 Tax=Dyadobacter arcticus TaxID=1078754 RepID=A0ABX0UQ22_9BACT|nr:ankyrin repeat domain-containing protein [Dyadobacter arcticus]NIJ55057.1 ankyrin repeat protein [Dyadobacter arcticus]
MTTTDVIPLIADPSLEYYEQKALELFAACKSVDINTIQHIRKYHPSPEKLATINKPITGFGLDDARVILARQHGFEDPTRFADHICELSKLASEVNYFEQAVEAVINGETAALRALLDARPGLTSERSTRAHEATLLHYVAANGTENFRQKTPANIVEIAEILLSAGSEVDALAKVYDQKWSTTLDLTVSSAHPAKAGVQSELVEKLLDYGAAINGINDDGSPLASAIYFQHPAAAVTLVARGARIDNVVTAAAMGKCEMLANYLDDTGRLVPDAPLIDIGWLDGIKSPQANLELAFVWAAMINQQETVSFLLNKGVSPAARDQRQWTALHWAAYLGYPEIVDLLLRKKAPLEARNEFGGTVLDQTLWATVNEGVGPHHIEIVRKLIEAGAKIHSWWLFAGLTPPLDERVAEVLQQYDL